jgi:hypothetical protein
MVLDLPMAESASLQFGISIRAWSLIFAAEAFVSSRVALIAIELIALRCRQGSLRVKIPRMHRRTRHSDDSKTLDPFKIGIASIPLELILSIRESVIDSALWDAEKKHAKRAEAAHEKYNHGGPRVDDWVPFAHCLQRATLGQLETLCGACATFAGSRIDYKVSRLPCRTNRV